MKLKMRAYRDEEDYWRIRAFLRQIYFLNQRREMSWQAYRFDYWRWHAIENIHPMPLEEVVFLWETPNGRIAAVLNPENPGNVFLQVNPKYYTPALAEEMLAAAERHLAVPNLQGRRKLRIWANEGDALLNALRQTAAISGVTGPSTNTASHCQFPSRKRFPPQAISFGRSEMWQSCLLAAGCPGKPFTRMSPMKITRAGIGTPTFSVPRFTAGIWISLPSPPTASWPPSAPCGSMM